MNQAGYFIEPDGLPHDYPSHVQWSGANRIISAPECDALMALAEQLGYVAATIGNAQTQRLDRNYRCVDVATLAYEPRTAWLYERITHRVAAANRDYYDFDLSGLLEPIQLLRYSAPKEPTEIAGHYDWHQDFGSGYFGRRKLSVVIQLSEGLEYAGCSLTLMTHRVETMNYRGRGEGVVFPSWTPHCVSSIESGTRFALVAWVHGAPFR